MKHIRLVHVLSLGFCLLMAACASIQPRYSKPSDFVMPMEKLASSIKAELHNPYHTNILSGDALLMAGLNGKPELQEAFHNSTLLITNRGDKAIILLVNPRNTNFAWLEDATWTSSVDRFHFMSNPPSLVHFSILFP